MARPKSLRMGRDTPSAGWETRREVTILTVEQYLPEFVAAVHNGQADLLIMHQDAFAGAYHDDELLLLGMAVKYAGLHGRDLVVTGQSGETFQEQRPRTPA